MGVTKNAFLLFAAIFLSGNLTASGGEKVPTANLRLLAGEMAAKDPTVCLGFETMRELNETIGGQRTIDEAKQGWDALAMIAAEQTDYAIEIREKNILIRPKVTPDLHDGPVVLEKVNIAADPTSWKSLADALKSVKFKENSRKFDPHFDSSGAFSLDTQLEFSRETLQAMQQLKSQNGPLDPQLSEILFLLARLAGARQWIYSPFSLVRVGEKMPMPQHLEHALLGFSAPVRESAPVLGP